MRLPSQVATQVGLTPHDSRFSILNGLYIFSKKPDFIEVFLSKPFIFSDPSPQLQAPDFQTLRPDFQSLRLKALLRRLESGIGRDVAAAQSHRAVKPFYCDPSHCFAMILS